MTPNPIDELIALAERPEYNIDALDQVIADAARNAIPAIREMRKAIEQYIVWWDSLSVGHHSPDEIEAWLRRSKPAIDAARLALSNKEKGT